jgi:AraC-like DNA-binding protein
VSVPELCAALGASEARLREAFQRIYGTGPSSYLRLRRLQLVRRKLRTTRREECTVSAAASSLGFYELGRFAGEYRKVSGSCPPGRSARAEDPPSAVTNAQEWLALSATWPGSRIRSSFPRICIPVRCVAAA